MPTVDRVVAAVRVGRADLAAWCSGLDVRGVFAQWRGIGRSAAGDGGGESGPGWRDRAGSAWGDRRPVGAAAGGPRGGAGLRLDAGAPARQVARGGVAAGDFGSCRLERVERDVG